MVVIISPFEDAVQKRKVLYQTSIKFTFLCIVKQWKNVTVIAGILRVNVNPY